MASPSIRKAESLHFLPPGPVHPPGKPSCDMERGQEVERAALKDSAASMLDTAVSDQTFKWRDAVIVLHVIFGLLALPHHDVFFGPLALVNCD